ncbi:MAG: nitronate monooxygenase [Thermoleophilia bacterium]
MGALETPLCALLGIRHAILLAGMAGGPNTPELVGAVSRAGGLGVLGVSGTTADATAEATRTAVRLAGGAPVGVNLQLAGGTEATTTRERMLEVLAPFRAELGLPPDPPPPPAPDPPLALLEAALDAGARVVTTWHDPSPALPAARAAGAPVLAMTTSVAGAVAARAAGADAVIAQGSESGGHRSRFGPGAETASETGTLALVPQVRDALGGDVPVIASGGIADGRGIAAALLVGAQGVSLGTLFLSATESGVTDTYRRALRETAPEDTVVTDQVTGRPARWIRNRIIDALVTANAGTLGWGAQAALIADLRREANRQGRADLMTMLAGQAAAIGAEPRPAATIVRELVEGTEAALAAARA